jgi:hypothetical protein
MTQCYFKGIPITQCDPYVIGWVVLAVILGVLTYVLFGGKQ